MSKLDALWLGFLAGKAVSYAPLGARLWGGTVGVWLWICTMILATFDYNPYNSVRVGEASLPGPGICAFDDPELGPCSESSDDDYLVVDNALAESCNEDLCWHEPGDGSMSHCLHDVADAFDTCHHNAWLAAESSFELSNDLTVRRKSRQSSESVGPPAVEGAFMPTTSFSGQIPGFVFTTRSSGTGYYAERAFNAPVILSLETCLTSDLTSIPMPPLVSGAGDGTTFATNKRHQRQRRRVRKFDAHWTPPSTTTLDAVDWRDHGCWAIDTSNPNSWTSAEAYVLSRSSADVAILQETRLGSPNARDFAYRAGRRRGWRCSSSQALILPSSRASGGCAVAVKQGTGMVAHNNLVSESYAYRLHFTWVNAILRRGIHVGSIYLRDSEGLSEANRAILQHAAKVVRRLRGPWVLAGDWNITSAMLRSTSFLNAVGGVVFAPELPTCNESTYDFFVVSSDIAAAIAGVQRVDDAGLNPHWPVRLLVRGDARRLLTRQLRRPPRIAANLPAGPLPCPAPQLEPPPTSDLTAEALDAAFQSWYGQARAEWASLQCSETASFQAYFVWRPPRVAQPVPDATKQSALWRSIAGRLRDIGRMADKQYIACRSKLVSTHLYRIGTVIEGCGLDHSQLSDARCWKARAILAVFQADWFSLQSLVRDALDKASQLETNARDVACRQWRAWLQSNAPSRGAGLLPGKNAYRTVKGLAVYADSPVGPQHMHESIPDEHDADDKMLLSTCEVSACCSDGPHVMVPLCDQADVDREAEGWASLWKEKTDYTFQPDPSEEAFLAAILPSMLLRAAASFPVGTGLGADNFSPRAIARLSTTVVAALCKLLYACELLGDWPTVLRLVLIVLLPKSDGGRRPIGLFPTVIRLWMRVRRDAARAWELANSRPCLYGGEGMGAAQASWRVTFRAEAAALRGLEHAQALLDLVKCFEKVPHHVVWRAAKKHRYSLWILRLSLASYRLPRAVGVAGVFSRLITPCLSITAGSGFATTELRIILLDVVDDAHRLWPSVNLTLFVDDLTVDAAGDALSVVSMVAGVTDHVVKHMQDDLLLEVSTKKSVVLAGRASIASIISYASCTGKLSPVRSTKLLGAPNGGGRRRCSAPLKVRTTAFRKRVPRFTSLRRVGVMTRSMVRAMGPPSIAYGVETSGMPCHTLQAARSAIARAASPPTAGRDVDITLMLHDGETGTLDPAFAVHAFPLHAWAREIWDSPQVLSAMTVAFNQAKKKLEDANNVWSKVTGPITALIATLWRLGWTMMSCTSFRDDIGRVLDLRMDSPAAAKTVVHASVRRWRLARIAAAQPQLLPDTYDFECPRIQVETACSERTVLVDLTTIPSRIFNSRGGRIQKWEVWKRSYASYLFSAVSGGQWPQARLAQVPGWTDDNRCQLCLEATGTLEHRLVCPFIQPVGGWPKPSSAAARGLARLTENRQRLLATRGLLVMRCRASITAQEHVFRWHCGSPEDCPHDAVWYIDGSCYKDAHPAYACLGYAIVVVSSDGELLAFGGGTPPHWATWDNSAAGAEAWALYMAVSSNPHIPKVVTDCLGLLDALSKGIAWAAGHARPLARIWQLIFTVLDGVDAKDLVDAGRIVWMPAHGRTSAIGTAVKSDGAFVSPIDWRANRLADAIAKNAALKRSAPPRLRQLMQDAIAAAEYCCARLGSATHAANNMYKSVPDGVGGSKSLRCRDSTARKSNRTARRSAGLVKSVDIAAPVLTRRPKLSARGRAMAHEAIDDAFFWKNLITSVSLRPRDGPTAAERMEAVRTRVRERARELVNLDYL